jgi:DNA phosphorothioation-dependent restriction protein DptG
MSGFLKIEFDNWDVFQVPIEVVQKDKANYYANLKEEDPEEFEERINEDLDDWAQNNMDWEDLVEHATLVKSENYSHRENFCNAKLWVD